MRKKTSTAYCEVLQTHLHRRPGDSQYNIRQDGHSLFLYLNRKPPIFEAVILPLIPQYMLRTLQEVFCSKLTLATITDHVQRHRTFT